MEEKNLIKGEITKTGKQTYLYYNKDGKVINVLPETAKKNNYKAVVKGNLDDSKQKIVEVSKEDSIDELDMYRMKEIERLKEKKEKKKDVIDPKIEKLIEQKEKLEKEREQKKENLLNKKLEKEKLEKENLERKQRLEKEQIKQKLENKNDNIDVGIKKINKKEEPEKPTKEKTMEDKMNDKLKNKENFIINRMFDNPIAEILKGYVNKNSNFEIFYNGKLIYSSKNTDKRKLVLNKDWFELFGIKYPYKGLRFKKI